MTRALSLVPHICPRRPRRPLSLTSFPRIAPHDARRTSNTRPCDARPSPHHELPRASSPTRHCRQPSGRRPNASPWPRHPTFAQRQARFPQFSTAPADRQSGDSHGYPGCTPRADGQILRATWTICRWRERQQRCPFEVRQLWSLGRQGQQSHICWLSGLRTVLCRPAV